jgi:hypothetical protein
LSDLVRQIKTDPVISMYKSREREGQVVIDMRDIGFVRFGFDGLYIGVGYRSNSKIIGVDLVEK